MLIFNEEAKMEPITAAEIYGYYMQNKTSGTQIDVIEAFLLDKLRISFRHSNPEVTAVYKQQLNKLLSSFKELLRKIKNAKKTANLNQVIFMDSHTCTYLIQLAEQGNFQDTVYPEDENRNASDENEFEEDEEKEKHFYKKFSELTTQSQRYRRTKELISSINKWVKKEDYPLHRLLGYIGYSHCYNENKKLAKIFEKIWHGEDVELKKEVPLETAIYLKERALISKRNYTDIRLTLKPFVELPAYNTIGSYIHQMLPELRTMNEGIMARVVDVAKCTIVRLPNDVIEAISEKVSKDSSVVFKAVFTAGLDGSGGFNVHNSKSYLGTATNASHLITVGMALYSIELDDISSNWIYKANNMCSFQNQRPIGLIPGKETRNNLKDVISELDIGIFQGRHNENLLDFGPFKARFRIIIDLTQMDTKMIKTVTGLTGAYCTACTVKESEAHSRENIKDGFPLNRSIQDTEQLFNELKVLDDEGNEYIPKKPRDYEKRQGLCNQPLTKTEVCSNITVLHSYLNALSFFERLLYSLNAGIFKMSSTSNNVKLTKTERQKIDEARVRVIEKARHSPLFMKIDTHDSTSSGTTDTGNIARKFFSSSSRDNVLDLIEGDGEDTIINKSKFKDLLQRFSIILRILSSKSVKIIYRLFEKFCMETYIAILDYFNWVHIPGSIHRLLGHIAERIHANEDFGLGSLSEEGLESSNKMVRRFRELGARKTGLRHSLIDIYSHWWVQSDGKIQANSRSYQCHNCFGKKPTQGGKRLPGPSTTITFNENEDELLFESFILY